MNIKPDNYICIQGWMITELGLKNSELMIYALIYGFSQDGHGRFRGKLAYLMEWTQASKQTVFNAINSLIGRGLIVKEEIPQLNGQRGVEYYATPLDTADELMADAAPEAHEEAAAAADGGLNIRPGVQKLDRPSPKIRPTQSKNWTDPVQKLDPDKYNNNYNNTHSDTQSINQSDDGLDGLIDGIKAQIEYDVLVDEYDADMLDSVVLLIADVKATTKPTVRIGGEDKPAAIVKSAFDKLTAQGVMQALDGLMEYASANTIANPRALLAAFLYNASHALTGTYCKGLLNGAT